MHVLVTGAGGFVGGHLVPVLKAAGHEVLALKRGPASADDAGQIAGPADLADIDTWPAWPADIDAVVHLAALNPSRRDRRPDIEAALRRANVEATDALARRAAREGVRRMIFLSTANVHGTNGTRPIRASDPLCPASVYARSKAQAETAFWNALAGSQTQGCVLRPAPVYGPGGRGNLATLAKLAKLPIPLPLKGLGQPRSVVDVDYLAQIIALCLDAPKAAGQTFLVADETPVTLAEIVTALREGWGRRPGLLPAPVGALRFLSAVFGKGVAIDAVTGGFALETEPLRTLPGSSSHAPTRQNLRAYAQGEAF